MKLSTVLCLVTALLAPLALVACNEEGVGGLMASGPKETRPIPLATLKLMDEKGMRPSDPILIRVFKEESTLEIWKRDKTDHYALLKSYNLCAWGGTIGPKLVEGDKMSPEGFYQITPGRMNPHSQFFLAFDLGYPNSFDRAYNRTGSAVMVHGNCTASAGCFVLTDSQVQEVYAIAREALAGGQSSFQVQAYPFRMTAANLARHRRNPNIAFWRNIKEGNDHFEVTRLEPKVEVCNKKYVFDAKPTTAESTAFNPVGACPAYDVPVDIASAVAAKQKADEADFRTVVAALDAQEKAAVEADLAMKLAAAKPKQPPVDLLASIMPKPTAGPTVASTTAVSVANATPINVPIPKPSPLDVARSDTTSGYQAEDKSNPDVIGNFLNYVKLPDFGKPAAVASAAPAASSAQSPAGSALQAVTGPANSQLPASDDILQVKANLPIPAPKPTVVSSSAPAPTSVPVETTWWKKLNPFGG